MNYQKFPNSLLYVGRRARVGMQGLADVNEDYYTDFTPQNAASPLSTTYGSTTGVNTAAPSFMSDLTSLIKGVTPLLTQTYALSKGQPAYVANPNITPMSYVPQRVGGIPTSALLLTAAGLGAFLLLRRRR